MTYFIIAFALWVGGKIFFGYWKKQKEISDQDLLVSIMVTFVLCLPALFFVDWDDKEVLKRVTLTVTDREELDHKIYLRFSDGYTQTATPPGHGMGKKDKKWIIVQKGDKVQKLIYSDGESEYTPIVDETPSNKTLSN